MSSGSLASCTTDLGIAASCLVVARARLIAIEGRQCTACYVRVRVGEFGPEACELCCKDGAAGVGASSEIVSSSQVEQQQKTRSDATAEQSLAAEK